MQGQGKGPRDETSTLPRLAVATPSAALVSAAAFPAGDIDAVVELVDRHALAVELRARNLVGPTAQPPRTNVAAEVEAFLAARPAPLSGDALLADPGSACWLSQALFDTAPGDHARPPAPVPAPRALPPPAERVDAHPRRGPDVATWPALLAVLPRELLRPLIPSGRSADAGPDVPPAVRREELGRALALLDEVWPEAAREVAFLVRSVAYTEGATGRLASGSSALCPFVVAIACGRGLWPGFLADTLVHEASHIKLRLAMLVAPMVRDNGTPRYRHPWRADLRPPEAILVACHAFVAIHRFYVLCVTHARCDLPGRERASAEERRLRDEVAAALEELRGATESFTAAGGRVAALLADEYARSCRLVKA
jgi:hypothetical protein